MNNNETLAYLAGLLDGEGSIMIRKSTYRLRVKRPDCVNPSYNIRVGLKNNNEDVIKLMKSVFGGHYHRDKMIYVSKNGFVPKHVMFSYNAEHLIAEKIIRTLLPYLIIKKPQALVALRLIDAKLVAKDTWLQTKPKHKGKFHYLPESIKKFDEIYCEVKRLNSS